MSDSKSNAVLPGVGPLPKTGLAGLLENFRYDVIAGFLVFLIALPLCLAISRASGFPPVAGIFTAIIGAVVTTFLSNSELTIKGPAAGMIVIVLGCFTDFSLQAQKDLAAAQHLQEEVGHDGRIVVPDSILREANLIAYRQALAVGVAAGIIQIGLGLFRSGILGEFFPISTVHGMLAAIGVIIISKQIPLLLGVPAALSKGNPIPLLGKIPYFISIADPEISLIGVVSLLILFGLPLIKNKYVQRMPGPMVVLLVSIPLSLWFNLANKHNYVFAGVSHTLNPNEVLPTIPDRLFSALITPNWNAFSQLLAWKWVLMYTVVGSLESLLSAKAIDLLDPWKRKTNLDRDLVAVGVANTLSSFVGGLPMISEIVRSRANITNGARTRYADMFHGLFLLAFVAMATQVIHLIPLTALAAMLIYTGFRLASPKEFLHVFKIGREQLVIYVSTIIGVLATDLLIGVLIGITIKFAIHLMNGVPLRSLFKPYVQVEERDNDTYALIAKQSLVFSNWIPMKRQIESLGLIENKSIVFDLSEAKFVDHSVMEKLHEMERDFSNAGLRLEVIGLEGLRQLSDHPLSARKRGLHPLRRITVITVPELQETLAENFAGLGATGYTVIPCLGAGRQQMEESPAVGQDRIRMEVLVPQPVADAILNWLRREIIPSHAVTASVENVEVLSARDFTASEEQRANLQNA